MFFSANAATLVYKGIVIALVDIRYDKMLTLIITVLLFLPSLIFAMFATMGRTNFKILVQHPSLLLMPTFTFFGFQRKTYGCFRKGGGEHVHKIMFSKRITMWNILINGVCFPVFYELVQVWQFDFGYVDRSLLTTGLLVLSLPLFILAILLSMIFIFMVLRLLLPWCGLLQHN